MDQHLQSKQACTCACPETPKPAAWGIGRQRKDGEALAGRLGWPIVREYSDNDLSASKYSHKPRQG